MTDQDPGQSGDEARTATPEDFRIVGIGASAGGLESLERLFTALPSDTGMAFVVIQHLSPDFKSLMDELLGRRTGMRVRQAEHDMPVQPNAVYLLPPMKEMIIRQRRLLLSDKDPRHGLTLPIDLFFRSLANDLGDRAVGIVLSGSGSDGSRGIQDISRAGGIVFCETSDTAQFSGMPLSAMRTGVVDHMLAPEEIGAAIAALNQPSVVPPSLGEPVPEDGVVAAIMRLLRDEYGIDFSHYKASTVTRRIERRLALNRSALDLDMYLDELRTNPRELNSLYEDLLIGVTRFFRDDPAFDMLERRVIPEIIERTDPHEQIRVWVPGCATGQEAYSIAMLLHEQLTARQRMVNVKILATDVHKASLEAASSGIYTDVQLAGVSPDRLQRFFTSRPQGYQVSQPLRETIVFAPHNLIRDAPFTKLDLISCRNLLIYFQPHAQKTVLTLFHFCLRPGGFLFLGSSESPGGLIDEIDTIDEHSKIYRKRRDVALPRDLKLPLPRAGAAPPVSPVHGAWRGGGGGGNAQLLALYDRLLDRFMPPAFLVDVEGQLVDSFGGLDALLRVKARRPSQNLVEMLSDDLRPIVSGALQRVRREMESVRYESVPVRGLPGRISLSAEPIRNAQGAMTHVLLSLSNDTPNGRYVLPGTIDVHATELDTAHDLAETPTATQDHRNALADELTFTKEHLQAAIEEHEATNEELQATNEELIASNEELQSTNEELHSVNEELYTVNAEYQKKNAELQELNDDIEHLLNGTDVGTLFLDRQLRIRKFTPRIADLFNVIPQDLGRPIGAFRHRLRYPTLLDDVASVLQDGARVETEAWDDRGRCYFMRVLPYRARPKDNGAGAATASGTTAPEGVVLTLTDVSPLDELRARLAQISAIVESSDDAIVGKSLDGIITSWNNGARRLYGYSAEEAIGRHVSFLHPNDRKDEIAAVLAQVREGRPVERVETSRVRKDGSTVDVSIKFSPIIDKSGTIIGVSAISRDITQLIRARHEVAEREERIRLLLDSAAEAIYGVDLSGVCIFCNESCARMLGYETPAALIGQQMHALILHTRADGTPYPPEQSPIFDAIRNRSEAHVDTDVLWRADGTSFPAEYWSHPIRLEGQVIGAVVTFLDISERRRAEQELQEAVRRREQFLAMLSHELRNPLAAILSATRFLRNDGAGESARQEAGLVVERQASHMARLLDDLLDVSRITYGRIVLRSETFDLRDATRSAIEALGPFMTERGTVLEVDITPEPLPILGDPARLQQVQANLLSNASKYSPRGGKVLLELRREDGHAVIRVTDNGQGIEPDLLPRIFDPFVQGQRSLARSEGGLGIGLTLLRSLVELHDGRVHADSDGHGKGSCFTVWLPLAEQAAAHGGPPPTAARRPVRTVVLVEDQGDARRMMQLLLESHNVTVFTAENGMEGAALIERVNPELALVDLGLPVMSGFDLARRVRRNGKNPETRLVALSGYGQDSDVRAALEAGFDEHLTKPPDLERIEQLLGAVAAD